MTAKKGTETTLGFSSLQGKLNYVRRKLASGTPSNLILGWQIEGLGRCGGKVWL